MRSSLIAVGLRAGRKQHTSEGYFLAGRRLRWPFIGASIYAANISTEHFVGLAGVGYVTGLAIGCYEWIAVFCLIPLIVLFLPFYIKTRIYTVPEFLERRFGPSVRLVFSAFMVVLSVLAKVSVSLWAASLVFNEVLGWNQMVVIWGVGLVTALYTMKGGLSAVVFTDAIQTVVLILAAVIMTAIGLHEVGGYEAKPVVRPATGNAHWQINQQTGQLESANRLAVTGPQLLLLPLSSTGETQMTGKTKVSEPFTAPCSGWVCTKVASDATTTTIEGRYDDAKGSYTFTFQPGGALDISYAFTIIKPVNPRQIGLVFALPRDCEVFS